MSFPTHSTPCFTWHLPTDSLVFCAPALLLLGLTPETVPRTMADFLDRLPEPQRRFLQRQRQMALAGQGPGCLSCAYTYNGRHVREDLSIIQCDADGRPQTILGTFDVRLPAGRGRRWLLDLCPQGRRPAAPGSVVRERLSTIRKALEAWNAAGGLPLELSFGLAGSDDGSVAPEVLLRQADARMMEEKNRVRAASHARIRAWLEARTGRKVPVDDPRL